MRADDGFRILSLLFKILDQGPTYSHQPILQILHTLLAGGLDLTETRTRAQLPGWTVIVARFTTGPLWKDAAQVLEAVLKAFPVPAQVRIIYVVLCYFRLLLFSFVVIFVCC
jgi:hypothetical protein